MKVRTRNIEENINRTRDKGTVTRDRIIMLTALMDQRSHYIVLIVEETTT